MANQGSSILVLLLIAAGSSSCSEEPRTGSSGASGSPSAGGTAGTAATGGSVGGGSGGDVGTGGAGASPSAERCSTALPPAGGEVGVAVLMRDEAPVIHALDSACDGSAIFVGTIGNSVEVVDSSGVATDVVAVREPDEYSPLFMTRVGPSGDVVFTNLAHWGQTGGRIGPYVSAFMDGSSVIAGTFGAFMRFAAGQPNETELGGGHTGYLARHDATGRLQWARAIEGAETSVEAVAAGFDGSTHACIGIWFGGTLGPDELDLEIAGPDHLAVATLDQNGRFVRATRMLGEVRNPTLRAMPDGALAFIADFTDRIVIADETTNPTTLTHAGSAVADVRFSSSLGVLSAHALPLSVASAFSALADGTLIAAGNFIDSLTLGAGEPNETTLVNVDEPGSDAFVASFDANADLSWVVQIAGTQGLSTSAPKVATLPDGSIWLGARTNASGPGSVVVGYGTPSATTLSFAGGEDGLVVRLGRDGRVEWAAPIESDEMVSVEAIAAARDSLWTAGTFSGTARLGAMAGSLGPAATIEAYLVRFGP